MPDGKRSGQGDEQRKDDEEEDLKKAIREKPKPCKTSNCKSWMHDGSDMRAGVPNVATHVSCTGNVTLHSALKRLMISSMTE